MAWCARFTAQLTSGCLETVTVRVLSETPQDTFSGVEGDLSVGCGGVGAESTVTLDVSCNRSAVNLRNRRSNNRCLERVNLDRSSMTALIWIKKSMFCTICRAEKVSSAIILFNNVIVSHLHSVLRFKGAAETPWLCVCNQASSTTYAGPTASSRAFWMI